MASVRTNCRLCGATCGVIVTHDGQRITDVRGDRDHPVSKGFTCPKGRAIPAWHAAPNRLDHPTLRGERVGWDVLLDDVAGTLRRQLDESGPESVAFYWGTGAGGYADLVLLDRLFDAIGSKQRYSAFSVDQWPVMRAAELVTGHAELVPTWSPDEPEPSLVLLVGLNPAASLGYMPVQSRWLHRMRGFTNAGGEVWAIDPRATGTAARADRHLALRPGTDVFLFGWLVRELLAEGSDARELAAACTPADVQCLRDAVAPFTLSRVQEMTGLAPEPLIELLATIRRHRKVVVLPGTGVSFGPYGALTAWLIWAVMIVTGSIDTPGGAPMIPPAPGDLERDMPAPRPQDPVGPGPASRPELPTVSGQRPAAAIVDEIEAGTIRSLIVYGGSPLTAFPAPDRTRAALERLDVLVVLDVVDTDLTRLATHVGPSTSIMEQAGFLYAPGYGDGRAYYAPAVLAPAAERRPAWWVFAELAGRLGAPVLEPPYDFRSDDVLRRAVTDDCAFGDAVLAAGSHGAEIPRGPVGWYHERMLPEGRWRIAPHALVERLPDVWEHDPALPRLISGRQHKSMNSVHFAGAGVPEIRVSQRLARDHAISDGDRVRVRTGSGSVEGTALLDGTLADGCVWLAHGYAAQNVNRLTDGRHINPVTGQPVFSAFPVELERCDQDAARAAPPAR